MSSQSGPQPPPYSGSGSEVRGSYQITLPEAPGVHTVTPGPGVNGVLNVRPPISVMTPGQIAVHQNVSPAMVTGFDPIETQNKVFIRLEKPGKTNKFQVLSFNGICMYVVNHVQGNVHIEEPETRCDQPRTYAPPLHGLEYSETITDREGKDMVVLNRYLTMRHKYEACWRCCCCCMFCWCCGRGASCWSEEMVAEVHMPAGTRIATISYENNARAGGDRHSNWSLRVVTENEGQVYKVLYPRETVMVASGSGPTFQLFRAGNNSPIGRIQRMLDENSGEYQVGVVFPVYDVTSTQQSSRTMSERAVILAIALFLEMEMPETGMSATSEAFV